MALSRQEQGIKPSRMANKLLVWKKAVEVLEKGSFMEDSAEVKDFRQRFINSQDEINRARMPKLRATLMKKPI
jgi:hypothetical protein